ncbi:hypothetical protein PI124_g18616 [Phytophthora idaei]|nr:hypothetical protein PI125_g22935 [Phytophthora idaei]KAG3128034.1 hypothetical protein PI126_g21584 [Phytophthora idaei]KAG3236382.1 hypothetical protein PI124_g18616 [Phytophthora idaei]
MLFGTTYAADPLPLFSQVLRIARRKTLQRSIQPQGIVVADIGFSEESEALSFLLDYDKVQRFTIIPKRKQRSSNWTTDDTVELLRLRFQTEDLFPGFLMQAIKTMKRTMGQQWQTG